tara:strand:- start:17114 stop:17704 length:591 start_codon:yes stop_codon:yes gene_type:complete
MGVGAAAIGGIGAIAKTVMGAKQARQAREAIENYQRQDLTNAYSSLSVSTLGADLATEELARATATGVQALQQGGSRALIGGMGGVLGQNIAQSRQIGAGLDAQQKDIDKLRAQDDQRIRQMMERREEQDLAGLGQQLMVGQQNKFSGIGDLTKMAGAFGGLMGGLTPQVDGLGDFAQGAVMSDPLAGMTGTLMPG